MVARQEMVWECDGCGKTVPLTKGSNPVGWLHVEASEFKPRSLKKAFNADLCETCAEKNLGWSEVVEDDKPEPKEKSPSRPKDVETKPDDKNIETKEG